MLRLTRGAARTLGRVELQARTQQLLDGIRARDRNALARSITLSWPG